MRVSAPVAGSTSQRRAATSALVPTRWAVTRTTGAPRMVREDGTLKVQAATPGSVTGLVPVAGVTVRQPLGPVNLAPASGSAATASSPGGARLVVSAPRELPSCQTAGARAAKLEPLTMAMRWPGRQATVATVYLGRVTPRPDSTWARKALASSLATVQAACGLSA